MDITNFESNGTVLVIYDISSNKMRTKFAKLMSSYGVRVQKSAFEIDAKRSRLEAMEGQFSQYIEEGDSIRLYHSNGSAKAWGTSTEIFMEDSMVFV